MNRTEDWLPDFDVLSSAHINFITTKNQTHSLEKQNPNKWQTAHQSSSENKPKNVKIPFYCFCPCVDCFLSFHLYATARARFTIPYGKYTKLNCWLTAVVRIPFSLFDGKCFFYALLRFRPLHSPRMNWKIIIQNHKNNIYDRRLHILFIRCE